MRFFSVVLFAWRVKRFNIDRRGTSLRQLPDPKIAIMIAGTGCQVWETASKSDAAPIDRETCLMESFIHFNVDPVSHHDLNSLR